MKKYNIVLARDNTFILAQCSNLKLAKQYLKDMKKVDKQRTIYESVFMYSQSILGITGEKTIIIYNKNSNNVFLRAEYLYKDGTVQNTAVCITDELLDFITELKGKNEGA